MPDWLKRHKIEQDMSERSYLQWMMLRSLAFGERDFIVISALLFLLDAKHDFLSWEGVSFMALGIIVIGPIYGIFLYLSNKLYFFRLKKKAALPSTIKEYKKMSWIVNICWLPVMLAMSYFSQDLFFQMTDELTKQAVETTYKMTSQPY